jgi:hypothetical protein
LRAKEEEVAVFIKKVVMANNDMLVTGATERDAGVSCRFRFACLQNSWDGKQSGKDSGDKEMCCDSISLSNVIFVFFYCILVCMKDFARLISLCVLQERRLTDVTVPVEC